MTPDQLKEVRTNAEMSMIADRLRREGGECDCQGDWGGVKYGLFRIKLRDGREFRHAGLHGRGGMFRTEGNTTAQRAYEVAVRMMRLDREEANPRNATIYLVHRYCGSEILSVPHSEIESFELESEPRGQ